VAKNERISDSSCLTRKKGISKCTAFAFKLHIYNGKRQNEFQVILACLIAVRIYDYELRKWQYKKWGHLVSPFANCDHLLQCISPKRLQQKSGKISWQRGMRNCRLSPQDM